ncbi:MAG: site-specific DNA-methyltransferase [Nitrosotalea sp.]
MTSKISKESTDLIEQKIKMLRTIIPECFSEGKLDLEKVRKTLGETLDSNDEKYSFSWAGRDDTFKNIQVTSKGTLIPVANESIDFEKTENLFIEGDNLEVLKLLQKSYFEKIKMIYIDPPYNKGTDLIYHDDFSNNLENYLEQTGQLKEGIKLTTNPETAGRFHSDWISFIYPRLFLARNLLKDDGVIFVSIDDKEIHNLRIMMNDIFGEENFISNLVWEGGLKNDSKFVSISHDYILCYAKNLPLLKENKTTWRLRKEGIDSIYQKVDELKKEYGSNYRKISEKLQEWYVSLPKKDPAFDHRHYDEVDERGIFFPGDISWPGGDGPTYMINHPLTKKPVKIPNGGWRFSKQETMLEQIKENRILFGEDEKTVPTIKRYLHETEGQVIPSVFYKDRRNAKRQLREIMGADVFDNPKDPEILQKLINLITQNSDVILDFFAGSGSTAHAVINQNIEDGGGRKFICVQIPEAIEEDHIAFKQGFKTISEICKERIRRVLKLAKDTDKQTKLSQNKKQDFGFKVFKLTKSNFSIWEKLTEKDISKLKEQMKLFESPLISKYTDQNVIFECIIKEGYNLNSKIEKLNLKSNILYKVIDDDNFFYITLDKKIMNETLDVLNLTKDDIFICIDAALSDSSKANLSKQCQLKTL